MGLFLVSCFWFRVCFASSTRTTRNQKLETGNPIHLIALCNLFYFRSVSLCNNRTTLRILFARLERIA